jgi:hypothetical protein
MSGKTMRTIDLDASHWRNVSDLYESILPAIGAPEWHGDSINALIDSMIWGGINQIHPPYRICIMGTKSLPEKIRKEIDHLKTALASHRSDSKRWHGKDVEVEIELTP